VSFTNASVSGETTTGGLNRFKKALEIHAPDLVILELGGNDGLRGYPISKIQANLGNMIALCQKQGIEILLIGMVLPPNYGRRYTEAFVGLYSTLAAEFNLAGFLPYLLSGIATDPNLLQRDGIHPTVAAQPLIKEQIKPLILNWLKSD
jgi:acyl-CoA thioesterase-1